MVTFLLTIFFHFVILIIYTKFENQIPFLPKSTLLDFFIFFKDRTVPAQITEKFSSQDPQTTFTHSIHKACQKKKIEGSKKKNTHTHTYKEANEVIHRQEI